MLSLFQSFLFYEKFDVKHENRNTILAEYTVGIIVIYLIVIPNM